MDELTKAKVEYARTILGLLAVVKKSGGDVEALKRLLVDARRFEHAIRRTHEAHRDQAYRVF